MTDVNITWLVVALMIGIIIGNVDIETSDIDNNIHSLIDKVSDIIKNEPLECPTGYYKVYADGFEPTGDEWSRDPDGSYVMCEKFKPVYLDTPPIKNIASIIDENNNKIGNILLFDYDTYMNMSKDDVISVAINTQSVGKKNIKIDNSTGEQILFIGF